MKANVVRTENPHPCASQRNGEDRRRKRLSERDKPMKTQNTGKENYPTDAIRALSM